jgi:nucleotide-binding universal stress UspA family protein
MERPAILYLTRRTPTSDAAFDHAIRLATRLGAHLTVGHMHPNRGGHPDGINPRALEHLAGEARKHGLSVEILTLGGDGPWARELATLDWSRWDLAIKVAEPGPPMARRLGLTLDQKLARAPALPVWFVPPARGAEVRVVVGGVDVGHETTPGLNALVTRIGAALAATEGARFYLVHAWFLVGESILTCPVRGVRRARALELIREIRGERRARLETLAELGSMDTDTVPLMVRDVPEDGLRRTARELGADLLVLGSHRREGVEGALVGNLAERFLGRDGLGVLVVKPGGAVLRFAGREVSA